MKEKIKRILMFSILLFPSIVLAKTNNEDIPLIVALGVEAFTSIHVSLFFLLPLSSIIAKNNDNKKIFWKLFIARIIILLFFDFFITKYIFIADFILIIIGSLILIPMAAKKKITTSISYNNNMESNIPITISNQSISMATSNNNLASPSPIRLSNMIQNQNQDTIKGIELRCTKCHNIMHINDKFCQYCGTPFDGNNIVVVENASAEVKIPEKISLNASNFDPIYILNEEQLLEEIIKRELEKANVNISDKLIPADILKRKKILNIIFTILMFIYITLIFFHFPIYTYIIGLIILIVYYIVTRRYNIIKYLKKELKARPKEKISNIIMSAKNNLVVDNSKSIFAICLILAIVLPLIIFAKPRILYEKVSGGYAVRYYIFGLTNFKTANIPETYKNEKVIILRGNTFSNMPFLKSIKLPDSITEIRGQAFKNCLSLVEINMPKNLQYLGGGAFYNAISIKSIELPDTLTYLGGEAFYSAKSLEYIKLSNNLMEIRGDTFEYCTSLRSITIPDSVSRIGGHAFYGDSMLSNVSISSKSKLSEIGSSAFRQCPNLYEITIPPTTYVNERAFKESPTRIKRYQYYIDIKQNDNGNYETDYLVYDNDNYKTDYSVYNKTKLITINNQKNVINFETGLKYNPKEIYISGFVSNLEHVTGEFTMVTEYYNIDYQNISNCTENIKLSGKIYQNVAFYCNNKLEELNENFTYSDIYYYKIYINNLTITD